MQRTRMFAVSAAILAALSLAIRPAVAAGTQSSAPATDQTDVFKLEAAYKVHSGIRNRIAMRLSHLWFCERELKVEMEEAGRKGDMAAVEEVEVELAKLRGEIDQMRAELSRENRLIAVISESLPD